MPALWKRGRMMEEIKRIMAKASYGQGTKVFSKGIDINTYEGKKPTQILGCIITDAEIVGCSFDGNVKNGKAVKVSVKFDIHLWYALVGDTKVSKVSTKFSDVVVITAQGAEEYSDEEVRAWIKQAPRCTDTSIVDGRDGSSVKAQIEYELGAEIVGQTTLNVRVINAFTEVDEEISVEDKDDFDDDDDD
jgi:hypothetical protein